MALHLPAAGHAFALPSTTRSSSSGSRAARRCMCSAVAEPPARIARASLSSPDSHSADTSAAAYDGGLFCIWPRFSPSRASGFGQAAQAAQRTQQWQLPAEIEALAGMFTDGPVSTRDQQQHWQEGWRYQGLRL